MRTNAGPMRARLALGAICRLAAVLLGLVAAGSPGKAADQVVLQLHGSEQFEFAGYYAALWQHFYEQAGIDVDIRPGGGQPPVDPVKEAMEGRAQFGTGTAQLMIRAAQGQPLLLLAPIFQQGGAALYYRADSDFPSPASLIKAKMGRLPATDILDVELLTALKAEGIDPPKLNSVPVEPGQALAALADRTVDAAMGSAWDLPWLARQRNLSLRSFDPGDYRVAFYGDTLFTLRRIERTQPDLVRRFRASSLQGWQYALDHPDEVIARMNAEVKAPAPGGDAAGFAHYQADLARSLANYPNVPLGHSNPDRWSRIEASMAGVGALVRTADPSDFVYDPEAGARNRNDERAALLLGAAVLASIVIGIVLVRRGRRARLRAPVSAAPPPTAPAGAQGAPPVATASANLSPAALVAELAAASPSRPNIVDLNQVLPRLERGLRQRLPERIALRLSPGTGLWHCRTDPAEVRRLLFDLAEAAADGIEGEGEVIIGTRNFIFDEGSVGDYPGARIGEYVRVTVRDNGPGFPPEAIDRMLEPGASARPAAAIAEPLMRSLGGFVRVESAEGVGTAIHLYFTREAAPARFRFVKAAE